MKIEILGPGCAKCKKLAEIAEQAIKEMKVAVEVVKIEGLKEIADYGVMTTPALAIEGEIKVAGRIAGKEEIKKLIREAQEDSLTA
jgi:small redox-active disulfide protein 2